MTFKTFLLLATLGLGNLLAQDPPPSTPDSEIIALDRQPDGVDLHFTGDPGQLYAVYTSEDGDNWTYLTMGAHIEGDVFHVHDAEALNAKSRLYRIVVLNQDCQQVDRWMTSRLVEYVQYRDLLSEARRNELWNAASQYHASMNATKAAIGAVKQAQNALTIFLKSLSEARFAWIAAQHETDAAMKAKEEAEKELAGRKSYLEDQKAERDQAIRMRDQQLHEKGVFLDWAKKFDEAGDTRKADEMRANAANALARFEEWHEEVTFLEDTIEALENDIAENEGTIVDHGETITEKTTAEEDAKRAYDARKEGKAPLEDAINDAKQAVKDAEKAQQDRKKAWAEKARKAREDGKKESDRRAAEAHKASEAGQAGQPAPEPAAPKPSARAIQIAKFLEHIKAHGGVDQYNNALKSMFGASLDAGLVTLEGLGAAMAQWASGKAASGGGIGTALASGVVSFGYGIIAGWVQDAATSGIIAITTKTIIGLVYNDAPNPGDAKFSPGRDKQKSTAELYLHNHDGTVTLYVFRTGKPLIVKNFRIEKRKE